MIDNGEAGAEQQNALVGDALASDSADVQMDVDVSQNADSIDDENATPSSAVSKKKGIENPVSDDAVTVLSDEDKELLRDLTKVKSSSERSKIKREREAFLTMLGLDPKELMSDFARLCGMGLDPAFALTGIDPLDRVRRMEIWVSERRKVMPRAGSAPLLKDNTKGQVSIGSERAEDAFNDVEEVTRLIFLSRTIASKLELMAADQRAFEGDLMDRLVVLQAREDKVEGSLPSWIIEIARLIEATGLQAASFRGVRRQMVEEVIQVLARVASELPDDVNKTTQTDGLFDRVASRTLDRAEADDAISEASAGVVDGQPAPLASGNDDDDDKVQSVKQDAVLLAPAFDEKALNILPIGDPAQRAQGHGMIAGIENASDAYAGFASQYVGTLMTSMRHKEEMSDVYIRFDERISLPAEGFSVGLDGEIDALNWAKFEVPAGPYKLVQMKGQSSFLPRYTEHGMLPPVASLEDAGNLLGMNGEPGVQLSLQAWGPGGSGPAHTRAHVLDGSRGDPAQAYEICRKLVAMQRVRWKDAEHVSELAMDSIARWWLFLLAGRMRPGQIDLLWPNGFFHGVEGHDPFLRDKGHFRLVRIDGGRIGSGLKAD